MKARILLAAAAAVTVLALLPTSAAFANTAPTCTGSHHVAVNSVVHIPAGSCSDADNDPIEYSVVDWPTGGSLVGNTQTGEATYTAFGGTSEDSFTFRAYDGQVFSNTATMTIEVPPPSGVNLPPACPDSHLFVAPLGSMTVHGNCVDPEGGPLSYGVSPFPTAGSLQLAPPATATYTHVNAAVASDSFGYTATDNQFAQSSATVFISIVGGNVFASAPEATPADPFVASIESPEGGPVLIDSRAVTTPPPTGFLLVGQEFDIEAPDASVEDPLRLVFTIDGSAAPAGVVQVFRDIATTPDPIPDCDAGADPAASPDPCVLSRVGTPPGDVEVVVLSSHASRWNFGVGKPHDFDGFFAPVNAMPTLNEVGAGRAVPVRFSLGGDEGLDILAPGYPKSAAIPCDSGVRVDGVESTVASGSTALSYDATADRYKYIWKTDPSWSGCRQLVLKLTDGSVQRANFRFR